MISVVIATHRRSGQLHECLRSLNQQMLSQDWEVIVVQDGEDEPLDPMPEQIVRRAPVRCFQQPHAGCGPARDRGAREARGNYLLFADDDCTFPADWLSAVAERVKRHGACLLAGRPLNALPDNPYSQATHAIIDYLLARYNAMPDRARLAVGGCLGVPREAFFRVGGFGRDFTLRAAEDRDFSDRWSDGGGQIVYAPEVVVYHAHPLTFRSFVRQHVHYGRGALVYYRVRALGKRGSSRTEPPSFYLGLFLSAWQVERGWKAWRLAMLLGISQAAHVAGFLLESTAERRRG